MCFRPQRISFEIELFEPGQQVFERAAPFGFESLTNGFAAPRQLSMTQLCAVQLFAEPGGAPTCFVEQPLRTVERRGRGRDGMLRLGQSCVGVSQQLLLCFQFRAPAIELLRKILVGIRQRGQLTRERFQSRRGGGIFLEQTLLAVDRDGQPRLRLRLCHLPRGARLAGLLLITLRDGHRLARFADIGIGLASPRVQCFGLQRELPRARIEFLDARDQPFRQRARLLQFAFGPLTPPLDFLPHVRGAAGFLLRPVGCFHRRLLRPLRLAQRQACRLGGQRGLFTTGVRCRQIRFQPCQLRTTLQRTRARCRAR